MPKPINAPFRSLPFLSVWTVPHRYIVEQKLNQASSAFRKLRSKVKRWVWRESGVAPFSGCLAQFAFYSSLVSR